MEVDPLDRIGPRGKSSLLGFIGTVVFLAFMGAIVAAALFGTNLKGELAKLGLVQRADFSAVYRRLGVPPLDPVTEADGTIARSLAKLGREPCDPQAATALADAVAKADDTRWAADALMGWAAKCGPDNGRQLRRAADLLLSIHDYDKAYAIMSDLVAAHPGSADYWYLQGKAEIGLKRPDAALLSYANTIHLSANPAQVGDWVFYEMSDLYAAEHRPCEAMGPIEDYVSMDPGARMTDKARHLIESYAAQGKCTSFAAGSGSFAVANANVIHVRASINGVAGTFIVDTGASFVVVDVGFAKKAHLVAPENGRQLRADTANGAVYNRLATAGSIKVGSAEARQVPVAILERPMAGVDGLLGRSFLSRFDVTFAATRWSLKPRAVTASR